MSGSTESIVLGGGCFWCTEAVFKEITGVLEAEPGYAGGDVPQPNYRMVCSGTTGHAEVVMVKFDPEEISLKEILEIFFATHDPTTLNRQGADLGTQYRSTILYKNDEQKKIAEETINEMTENKIFKNPIVTKVEPLSEFYPAEEYHHDYYAKNPLAGYCMMVISPKVSKLRKKFSDRIKVKN
jgi:peptide-methionine (S)-S-oxide reductase